MEMRSDGAARMNEPLRQALDAILLRWLGLYVLAGAIVVCPILCGVGVDVMPVWRAALPVFLVGFIAVHLAHRQREPRSDGWRRAVEADAGRVRMLMLVGLVAVLGVAACIVAIFWPYEDLVEILVVGAMGPPLLVPLFVTSVWVAIDCATRRLARSADESDRVLRDYWRRLAQR